MVQDAFDSLFARADGSSIEAEIARVELRRVLWSFVDRLMNAAVGNSAHREFGDWAARMLAEILVVHEKSADWFSSHSQAFKDRVSALRERSHLLFKRAGGFDDHRPSPLTIWLIRAHERFLEVVNLAMILGEIEKLEAGKAGGEFYSKAKWFNADPRKGISEVESTFLKAFLEIEKKPVEEQSREIFSKIIWPWLVSKKSQIEKEDWCEDRKIKSGGYDQRSPSFANLKRDFRHLWKGYFTRPAGDLRGIERAS